MDHQKDIQKDTLSIYGASNDFYEHARKIVTAIYLLTDLFENREPLKWRLRSKILETMSDTGVLSRSLGPVINRGDEENILEDISSVRSLLDIGVLSGMVSPMNHEILSRELLVFQENAVRHFHLTKGNQSLYTESLFAGFDWKQTSKIPRIPQGHFKRTKLADKRQDKTVERMEKNVFYNKPQTGTQNGSSAERKEKIIQIIQGKGNAMIKDISQSFTEFSEKTIQRDLIELVSQGRIKKSGERRWTVYSPVK